MRSSSRRTTPQSPPQPRQPAAETQQSKRTTRSQSRDVSDGESIALTDWRTARGAIIESNGGRAGRRKKDGTRAKPQQGDMGYNGNAILRVTNIALDLSVVIEATGDTESNAHSKNLEIVEFNGREQPERAGMDESPGSLSAISGTTARTSHSAQELADLDSFEMMDALPDLADVSDKILNLLIPEEVSEESIEAMAKTLQDHTDRLSKKLARLYGSFESTKKIYGNEPYINISIATRGSLAVRRSSQVGSGPWRPDIVFYKANVAQLITSLFSLSTQLMRPWVEKMERDFPIPFLSHLSKSLQGPQLLGPSSLLGETIEAAFNIRMQFFLSLLYQHYREDNFDPDVLLSNVFYADSNSIKGWDIDGLRTKELTRKHQKMIAERLNVIQEIFNAQKILDVESLKSKYPWSGFASHLVSWGELRREEIEAQLVLVGGIERIHNALNAEIKRRADPPEGNDGTREGDDSPLNVELDFQPSDLSQYQSDQPEKLDSTINRSTKSTLKINPG